MRLRILTSSDVKEVLPMVEAIEAMREAFYQFSTGQAVMPLRSRLQTDSGTTLLMPAHLRETADFAIKIVSVYEKNAQKGLPIVTATVLALDPRTGIPLALMDGTSLTAIRTGAAGGLAADLLARRDARRVLLFGAGVQTRAQLLGVLSAREIEKVFIVSRHRENAEKLAREIRSWPHPPIAIPQPHLQKVVRNADIIIAATTSHTPLFDGRDLTPGTHVTAVGAYTPEMQEIDKVTMTRARVIVDSREACLAEAGDIIKTGVLIDAAPFRQS